MTIFGKKKEYSSSDNKLLYKRTGGTKILFTVMFIALFIYALTFILPFVWVLIQTFKEPLEYEDRLFNSSFDLPKEWLISNWTDCFSKLEVNGTNFFGMLWNSLYYVMVGGFIAVFFEVMTAYVIVKYSRFKITKLLYVLYIFFLAFPVLGQTGANYRTLTLLHIADSPLYAVIMPMAGFGSSFLIFCASWEGVSDAYAEAARIDGAGHYTIFFRVMLPMVVGPMVAVLILAFVGRWNQYSNILLMLPSYPTLATGLFMFRSTAVRAINMPMYYAGLLISITPPLILFILFSDTIMNNVSAGGIKG